MPRYRLNNIKCPLEATVQDIKKLAAESLNLADLTNFKLIKKSLDARKKSALFFVCAAEFDNNTLLPSSSDLTLISEEPPLDFTSFSYKKQTRPIVIGSGPAGMMAALCLAKTGARPIVIERGAAAETRRAEVHAFWQKGNLNPNANVQFGEGGAGTFSDGKLMSGIKKDRFTAFALNTFVSAGAPDEILYLAHPHIGTDNLFNMVINIRKQVEALGGEYRFCHTLTDIRIKDNAITAAIITDNTGRVYELPTDTLIIALGHSARDTFRMLYEKGITLQQKPFAVGCRIEHRQADVNFAQYGKKYALSPYLGAAEYKAAVHLKNGRSLYTFCMCPGGEVVAATNLAGHIVTNGMSEFARAKTNANAALLVNVDEKDFGSPHPLAGIAFQEMLEKRAFTLGGGNYFAPVQLVKDLLAAKKSTHLGTVIPSYRPGVTPADFKQLFPKEIYDTLRLGLQEMAKKLPFFATQDAVLTAVESRSSSPIRICRDETGQSSLKGLYPIGEGAGYAGGITSAAADGVKLAFRLLNS